MLLLSDLFEYLSYGELSQYAIGTGNSGNISEDQYPAVISYVNLGLTKLFSRLPLKQEEVIIQQILGKSTYKLDNRFAVSNDTSPELVRYILDTSERPFTNDLLKIEQVYHETGEEVSLNDPKDPTSIYTPSFDVILIPETVTDNTLSILYRAKHPKLLALGIDPTTVTIDIPEMLIEPLLIYVASRVISVKGSVESKGEADILLNRFEVTLAQLAQQGIFTQDLMSNHRLEENGWV